MTSVAPIWSASELLPDLGVESIVTSVVDGEWVTPSAGDRLPVLDPATGHEILSVIDSPAEVVDRAVTSAHSAFHGAWGRMQGAERGRVMNRVAARIRHNANALSRAESIDSGKPITQARADVETAARYFEFYAGICDKLYGELLPQRGGLAYTLREPYGPVAVITPWNSPIAQMCRSVAPALAAGNTVVVKPSELTPVTSVALGKLFVDAGLAAGVCNVVTGCGQSTGTALINHPLIQHIAFTGSVETGRLIGRVAGERIRGVNLELGGKSATIILPDADLKAAARAGVSAVVRNSGQSCFATTRLVVHRAVHEELVELMVHDFDKLTVGAGLTDPDVGPLVSDGQRARALRFIDEAVADGVTVANAPIELPEGDGFFTAPSLLVGVRNDMRVAREEVFGPVQSVIVVDSEEEAVAVANDSDYGLAAGIFTSSLTTAHRLAASLEAGQVQVNRYPLGGVDTPFGGYKNSGIGREKGLEALRYYSQTKTVIVHLGDDS